MLLSTPLGFVHQLQVSVYFYIQSTPDNSNLQGKLEKVRVIASSSYRQFEAKLNKRK